MHTQQTLASTAPTAQKSSKPSDLLNTSLLKIDISYKLGSISAGQNSSGNPKSRLLSGDYDVSLEDSIFMVGLDKKSYRPPVENAIYKYLHASGIAPIEVGAFLADSRNHHCHTRERGAECVPQS